MNIVINRSSQVPMYMQIKNSIRKEILKGKFKNGQRLPSFRQLAKELNVSEITTKRAYIDLEHDGFIYFIYGKGTYVNLKRIEELHIYCEEDLLNKLITAAKACYEVGISKERIIKTIDKAL